MVGINQIFIYFFPSSPDALVKVNFVPIKICVVFFFWGGDYHSHLYRVHLATKQQFFVLCKLCCLGPSVYFSIGRVHVLFECLASQPSLMLLHLPHLLLLPGKK